jgi:hypothetical protein
MANECPVVEHSDTTGYLLGIEKPEPKPMGYDIGKLIGD